jgi:response regulator of citrate/malate metabolism
MKMIYNSLVVEDEFLCTKLITNFLKKYDKFKTPQTAANLTEASRAIKKINFV